MAIQRSGGFLQTPLRDEALLNLQPIERRQAFVQEWLYFVFVEEVLRLVDIPVHLEEFIAHSDEQGPTVNSACLTKHIVAWRDKATHPSFDKATVSKRLRIQFVKVAGELQKLSRTELGISSVALSIMVLLETPSTACSVICEIGYDDGYWVNVHHDIPKLRLREQGWCSNKINMLKHTLNTSRLYIASNLKGTDRSNATHESCTEYYCQANNIDRKTYKPKHVEAEWTCPEVSLTPESLAIALDTGGYPVIQVLESGARPFQSELSVRTYSASTEHAPYVAFSHVWSDGIGNLQANGLPACQLRRLGRLAAELYPNNKEPPFIWLDTLCGPYCNDEASRRRLAIGRMHETYRCADSLGLVFGPKPRISQCSC